MTAKFLELTITDSVRKAQQHYYKTSRPAQRAIPADKLTSNELDFIKSRDSFYLATVSETGWPYIQHRGGDPGFLHVLSPTQLAFADFRGNRQLISSGNIEVNDRVALFLMDYPRQARLKILGYARVEDATGHLEQARQLAGSGDFREVERLFFIDVVAFDWNCPQHITPRFTVKEVRNERLNL